MSQSGRLISNAPVPGAGIQTVTGNAGGAVPGDGGANINIVGVGDIDVTGNIATNTLTISSSGTASQYLTDDGNFAVPALGILDILGTANQIQTSSAGNIVTIAFENDVTMPHNLTVTNDLDVFNNITAGNDITATVGDIIASAGNMSAFGSVTGDQLIANNGLEVNAGGINSVGQVFLNGAGFANVGVLIRDAIGTITSSTGANGQILIGGGVEPQWANITAGTGITIVNGVNALGISCAGAVALSYHEDAGIATPAVGVLNIVGSANINTVGAGNTVTINLDNNLAVISVTADTFVANTSITAPIATITNNLSVTNTITATTVTAAGTVQGTTLHATQDVTAARDVTAGRNVVATAGMQTVDLLVTHNAEIDNQVQMNGIGTGVVQTSAVGILSASNGTNGQLLIGGGINPAWANITSTDGTVVITNGAHSINLSSPAAAGFGVTAFKAVLMANFNINATITTEYQMGTNITGIFSIAPANLGFDGHPAGSYIYPGDGLVNPMAYTAPSTGLYNFILNICASTVNGITLILSFIVVGTSTNRYDILNPYEFRPSVRSLSCTWQANQDIYLTAGDIVYPRFTLNTPNGTYNFYAATGAGKLATTYFSGVRIG